MCAKHTCAQARGSASFSSRAATTCSRTGSSASRTTSPATSRSSARRRDVGAGRLRRAPRRGAAARRARRPDRPRRPLRRRTGARRPPRAGPPLLVVVAQRRLELVDHRLLHGGPPHLRRERRDSAGPRQPGRLLRLGSLRRPRRLRLVPSWHREPRRLSPRPAAGAARRDSDDV